MVAAAGTFPALRGAEPWRSPPAGAMLDLYPMSPGCGGARRVNRFEQAVYDCMIPTAKLLNQTAKPLHRAMLLNFWRHVHLEGPGSSARSWRRT